MQGIIYPEVRTQALVALRGNERARSGNRKGCASEPIWRFREYRTGDGCRTGSPAFARGPRATTGYCLGKFSPRDRQQPARSLAQIAGTQELLDRRILQVLLD